MIHMCWGTEVRPHIRESLGERVSGPVALGSSLAANLPSLGITRWWLCWCLTLWVLGRVRNHLQPAQP